MKPSKRMFLGFVFFICLATLGGCCEWWPSLPWCKPQKEPTGALRIHFSSLIVHDDKEGGEGDWRIKCTVNGEEAVWISSEEAGTGESVNIDRTFVTKPEWNRVEVFCKIHEQDGDEWEYVGEDTHVYEKGGDVWPNTTFGQKSFPFDVYEGRVTLQYSISSVN